VLVCDTIKFDEERKFDKLEIVSVADVFGESMKRIVEGTSLSSLFQGF
jgi:ribose-phosphate pyrophosphokinase